MTLQQKIVVIMFTSLFAIMVLFPPFTVADPDSPMATTREVTGFTSDVNQRAAAVPVGYHFIFVGPDVENDPARTASIYFERLAIQLGLLTGLFVVGLVLFRDRSDAADRAPEKIGSTEAISNARH